MIDYFVCIVLSACATGVIVFFKDKASSKWYSRFILRHQRNNMLFEIKSKDKKIRYFVEHFQVTKRIFDWLLALNESPLKAARKKLWRYFSQPREIK